MEDFVKARTQRGAIGIPTSGTGAEWPRWGGSVDVVSWRPRHARPFSTNSPAPASEVVQMLVRACRLDVNLNLTDPSMQTLRRLGGLGRPSHRAHELQLEDAQCPYSA